MEEKSMKCFVITLKNNTYSEQCAKRCIESAKQFNIEVEPFYGIEASCSIQKMKQLNLTWTWANNNTKPRTCPITGLYQHVYTGSLEPKIGCFLSHYYLWKKCVELNEPILILEHDAIFIRLLPEIDFNGICMINDPLGATRKGAWWHTQMVNRGGKGVFPKTWVTSEKERHIPDGLAGNSAYLIKPLAAKELITKTKDIGVWPNDALMSAQIFPGLLHEYYPFITKVNQTQSTTQGT